MVISGMRWEPNHRITTRQFEVWRLVSHGLNNDDIAKEIGFNSKLIQYEIGQLYDKLHISEEGNKRVKLALMFPVSP